MKNNLVKLITVVSILIPIVVAILLFMPNKIDLFGEVLENIKKDYVDEVIQYANNGNENCFVIGEMVEKCESSVFLMCSSTHNTCL